MAHSAPRLTGLATATPPHRLDQPTVRANAAQIFQRRTTSELERLLATFDTATIRQRYACLTLAQLAHPRGWADGNALYRRHAGDLLCETAARTLADANLPAEAIDVIIVVSTTGIATPSLDTELLNRLPFRPDVERVPLFGLGCCGGTLGLGRAAALAQAIPGRRVLLLTVELCSLTFRPADSSNGNIVAAALFGDGAGGAILSTHEMDSGPALVAWGEHTWPATRDVMGWQVADDGLGVLFARRIPALVRAEFGKALDNFLEKQSLICKDIYEFACHPGGPKVLDALEECVGLAPGGLATERDVLADYGNMSSPTILFVLNRKRHDMKGPLLATALGPGFSAGFALFLPAAAS